MQKILRLLLTGLLIANVCQAQFSATGGANGVPYVYKTAANTHLDHVYVYKGLENARLSYATDNPSGCKWYRFRQNPSDAVELLSDVQQSVNETALTNIQAGYGYIVEINSLRRYVYIVDYLPVEYIDIIPCKDCDVCNTLGLSASVNKVEDMIYYSTDGSKQIIERQYTVSWNTLEWNPTDKTYAPKERTSAPGNSPNWSINAPLTDTYFVVKDQFATLFGENFRSLNSYKAVAVQTNADWKIQERTAENELDKVSTTGELSGSAPLRVEFRSNPSDAVQSYVWQVYESADTSGSVRRYTTEENLLHSFEEAGTFLVKVTVSNLNGKCSASKTFSPKILESFIDCPNFFTPRSSPGENDEFRVAYKSIVSFKGVIVNRWGNVLFEWSDPALGWNGTFKGKAVSPGVYFYLIEAKGSDGIVYKKKGDINLLE